MMKYLMRVLLICCLIAAMSAVLMSCGGKQEQQNPDGVTEEEQAGQEDQEPEAPEEPENTEDEEGEKAMTTEINTDNITVNTQSSIKIEGSKTIYIDPYKRGKAPHDADLILITHAHYDHFDEPSLRNSAGEDTVIVCPASMNNDVSRLGIGSGEAETMEAGDEIELSGSAEGIKVEAVPAYNTNKNFHPKANGWLGYIITMDGVRYYTAGDTDALSELEDVDCDIAFVPVGGTYTMTATEAAGLVNKIRPQYAVPIHYGTIVGRAADADTFGNALDDGITLVKKVEDAK